MALASTGNSGTSNGCACDYCNNLVYDEDEEDYFCDMDLDEDDMVRLATSGYKSCPFFQSNDEYLVVRHQA